jgi:hypothetical protein
MKMRLAFATLATLTVAACATSGGGPVVSVPPVSGTAAFRTSDFAWSTAPGTGRVDGQLTYKSGGHVYSCTGAGVLLTPDTPWVRQRTAILYRSTDHAALPAAEVRGRTPPEKNQDYSAYVRHTACDGDGRFSFAGLPDGTWYAITLAKSVNGPAPDMALMHRVTTHSGKVVKVTL